MLLQQTARVLRHRSGSLGAGLAPRVCSGACRPPSAAPHVCRYSTQPARPAPYPGVLSVEDRLDIMELCNRFDAAINNGQQQALGQFFADDAEVHHPKGVVAGVDALLSYFRACEPLARGNRHLTCNIVVEPAPDGAAGRARASAYRLLHRAANPPALLASGTIEDELVKSAKDGRWRFARRRFVMDPPAAGAAAAGAAAAAAPAPGAQQRAEQH
ncbi:hypothetical protein Rsub_06071 [Raphidocelis subcapitata]|uniref:SnoaL-like domain-containing protein n=1 Tax=Raphidocelis subcapitata TaxID=307507 RepID=A0A2V0P2D1_9CHLO|nr:hypothetical protein Rsub_06071 [Raphidocelis subcapitata]|eukprot:GBF93739.1 hypothetical protein Rsub_06071 [Raphidocelis subcapitata]